MYLVSCGIVTGIVSSWTLTAYEFAPTTALQRKITNLTREDNMDRSAGERRVAAEKDVVGRTVSVKWTLEVPRVAVSWAVPTDKPATVNVTSLELAGTVTLRGAATIAGSALEMRTEVSVVAVLEMATVTVEVVATLKAGVVVVHVS